ncbi:MAG: hypothetical protein H7333_05940 [Bdellovibrionales bacterium]|nr:hypothetical protein [Oligoflexia bacterium]
MVETIEARFGNISKLPTKIQWLIGNGPAGAANKTLARARILNLEPSKTPSHSSESNGMAEAFAKKFKRDYEWAGDLSSAEAVMIELPNWFNDYNEVAPRLGLRILSPRQFTRECELENLID